MTNGNHDRDFPADGLDRWVQDQRPAEPSATFLGRCLATIPQAGVAKVQAVSPTIERDALTEWQEGSREAALGSQQAEALTPKLHEQTIELRKLKMKRHLRVWGISGALASSIALFVVGSLWLTQPAEAQKAAAVLARGAEAVPNPVTVHLVAKMRTPPEDNFESVNADSQWVPIQVWRQFGDRPKWRVEKPGVVTVMDDTSITSFYAPDRAWRYRRPKDGNCDDYPILLLRIAQVRGLLDRELRTALANQWDLKLAHETTAAGEQKLLVTVEARYDWPEKNPAKNKSFESCDMRRVYRFDAQTQRLEGMDAYLHRAGGDVLVLTVEHIEYDRPIDPMRFWIDLPKNVRLVDYRTEHKEPEVLPDNEKYERMTPREAAHAFLEACAKKDWAEVQKFDTTPVTEFFRNYYGGLQIVSLGEPFQMKGVYHGWYIPYEIKFNNGEVKKWNLAMYKARVAKRYIWDGGM